MINLLILITNKFSFYIYKNILGKSMFSKNFKNFAYIYTSLGPLASIIFEEIYT